MSKDSNKQGYNSDNKVRCQVVKHAAQILDDVFLGDTHLNEVKVFFILVSEIENPLVDFVCR